MKESQDESAKRAARTGRSLMSRHPQPPKRSAQPAGRSRPAPPRAEPAAGDEGDEGRRQPDRRAGEGGDQDGQEGAASRRGDRRRPVQGLRRSPGAGRARPARAATASPWRSSATTARARPPSCAWPPGCWSRATARSWSTATRPDRFRPGRPWPTCRTPRRSTRTCRCGSTSSTSPDLHGHDDWEQDAADLLDHLGLYDRADDLPTSFSRGLRQKASIAMAFIRPFDVLLVDEPFVGLDASGKTALLELLAEAHKRRAHLARRHARAVVPRHGRPLRRPAGRRAALRRDVQGHRRALPRLLSGPGRARSTRRTITLAPRRAAATGYCAASCSSTAR